MGFIVDYLLKKDERRNKEEKEKCMKEAFPNGEFTIDALEWLVNNQLSVCESHYTKDEIDGINEKGRLSKLHQLDDNNKRLHELLYGERK